MKAVQWTVSDNQLHFFTPLPPLLIISPAHRPLIVAHALMHKSSHFFPEINSLIGFCMIIRRMVGQ